MIEKECPKCKQSFQHTHKRVICCSQKCSSLLRWEKGLSSGFKKGHKAFSGTEATRFREGNIPWNKGEKRPDMIGNSWNKGKHNSPATEIKKGQFAGDKHHNWKGGITPIYKKLISSYEWKKIRIKVLERDGSVCQACKKFGNAIDHIIPWRISRDNSLKNLQVLCTSCNTKKMVIQNEN